MFVSTSLFQNRFTRKSFAASQRSRFSSRRDSACCPPSTSITRRAPKQTKSPMNGPSGTCRRNLKLANHRSRNANQSLRSASVICERRARARVVATDGLGAREACSLPSPPAGEGAERRRREAGEGCLLKAPSPGRSLRSRPPSPAGGEGDGVRGSLIAQSPRWFRLSSLSTRYPSQRVRRGYDRPL